MRVRSTARTAAGLVLFCVATAGGCKKNEAPGSPSAPGGTAGNRVSITIPAGDGYTTSNYSPTEVTVAAGGTVVWLNRDGQAHTTVSDDNLWSTQINAGAEFSRTFSTRGKFEYHCTLHSGMRGSITVQ